MAWVDEWWVLGDGHGGVQSWVKMSLARRWGVAFTLGVECLL